MTCSSDELSSLFQVAEAVKEKGLGTCGLIFGIDYTMSNKVQGEKTFRGRSLHDISEDMKNPYQQVIEILGETLEYFDNDRVIPAFGFGDFETKDQGIFSLTEEGYCHGFREVLDTYNMVTPCVKLYRPTNFAPIIYKAINIVEETKKYHILVIVADGQMTSEEDTERAIVKASECALSIIVIGVGDGPWGVMREFDDKLPDRLFDNFQFVEFNEVMASSMHPPAAFALSCLKEIPHQYKAIKELGYLEDL
ncbi:uncharacterized protein LOC123540792 isoform X1 [Mercenaria mercenaria]|uniref:uncharacterized protein LOC123540792 isoform X1 n=1 Tax=Mercenaria mercenaria TaxID=6596 RepID=UPI00234F2C00|nr:uncharacterized protein LOC123540792 isoform X1 [Mercenaria mercenaria]